jgi:hypothetical protein
MHGMPVARTEEVMAHKGIYNSIESSERSPLQMCIGRVGKGVDNRYIVDVANMCLRLDGMFTRIRLLASLDQETKCWGAPFLLVRE